MLVTMSPSKGDTSPPPHLWIIKDNLGDQKWFSVYRIDINVERLITCSNKHNLHLKNIFSSNNKSKQQSTFRSKQQSMTSCRFIVFC